MIKIIRHVIHHILIDYFPKIALMRDWRLKFKTRLNLKNPQTLNEKIQWMMLNTDLTLWAKCADKYKVRSYIKECGYEKELPKLYGVWKNVDEINYENLPEKFVIKCNHDCGSTHVIDKSGGFNKKTLNADLKRHLKTRFGYESCELHYIKIKPLIMAEEFLPLSASLQSSSQIDYKFWCLDGKIHHCFVVYNRLADGHTAEYSIYKLNPWRLCPEGLAERYRPKQQIEIKEPPNLDKMIKMAERLCQGFPVVRVDLYNVNGKIYFGELTFTSGKGKMQYFSEAYQKEMGSLITLPKTK